VTSPRDVSRLWRPLSRNSRRLPTQVGPVDSTRPVQPGPVAPFPAWVPWALAAGPALFLAVFFAWPVASIIGRGLSLGALGDVLTDPGLRSVAWFTLWQAVVSTVLTVAIAMPGAYMMARYRFRGRSVVLALVTVPFVLPTVVVGAAFLALLPDTLHDTVWAVLIAHVFFNYAVVVRTVSTLWAHLDPHMEEAARLLGASRWRAFREVTLPLLRPAIVAAASIVFLFTFTSFGVVLILGGPRHPTIEVEIFRQTAEAFHLDTAAALAVLQLAAMALLLAWWTRGQEKRAVSLRLQPAAVTTMRPRTWQQRAMLIGNLAVMALLLGVPLARLVERSFATPSGYGLAFYRALGNAGAGTSRVVEPVEAVVTSLRYAAAATVLSVGLGLLAAGAIAYGRGTWRRRLLDTGLMLPLGTSAVTIGFGLLITMDRAPLDLRGTWIIIPIAHALVAMPFVVRALLPSLRAIDPRQREAAALLGAPPRRVWREVDLPMVTRAGLVGAGFAFAVSIGEFGATSFLVRTGSPTLPIKIEQLLGRPGAVNVGQSYALATILMVVTAVVMLAVDRARVGAASTF
jgi:thiamine transport system permease protein